jgi:hypothetical protein
LPWDQAVHWFAAIKLREVSLSNALAGVSASASLADHQKEFSDDKHPGDLATRSESRQSFAHCSICPTPRTLQVARMVWRADGIFSDPA